MKMVAFILARSTCYKTKSAWETFPPDKAGQKRLQFILGIPSSETVTKQDFIWFQNTLYKKNHNNEKKRSFLMTRRKMYQFFIIIIITIKWVDRLGYFFATRPKNSHLKKKSVERRFWTT